MEPEAWLPIWVAVAAGVVLGAIPIAYAFSRPMSKLKRLGSVVLGLIVLAISPAIGLWFILLRIVDYPTPPAP